MRTATVLTASQTLYFKYKDYSKLDLIVNKKKHPIEVLKEKLKQQGFTEVEFEKPLNINKKEYHLIP